MPKRRPEPSNQYKSDYRREKKGKHSKALDGELDTILELLTEDKPLPKKYKDHALTGNLKGFRDCHVFHNLVLLYGKPDDDVLWLVRLGSHQEIGLGK